MTPTKKELDDKLTHLKKCAEEASSKPTEQLSIDECCGLVLHDHHQQHVGGPFRPNPPFDPNAPVKPRPIIDAIKKMILDGLAQYGPQIIALIGPLIQKWITSGGLVTGMDTPQTAVGAQSYQRPLEESGHEPGRENIGNTKSHPGHDLVKDAQDAKENK